MKRILFIFLIMHSCIQADKKENMKSSKSTLKYLISNAEYGDLFLTNDSKTLNQIWDEGNNKNELEEILGDEKSPQKVKFLAAEILRNFDIEIIKRFYQELSSSYTYSLVHTGEEKGNSAQLNANLWGFLYAHDDAGHLGEVFIELGDAAIGDLKKILDNNSSIFYEGSKEATIGNSYKYRIKDFAAFYIAKIKGMPITFYQDFDKRDVEIERLKKKL